MAGEEEQALAATEEACRVYVGNLLPKAKEIHLTSKFARFGTIHSVWIARRPPGFAFVRFAAPDAAQRAVKACRGEGAMEILGKAVRVQMAGDKTGKPLEEGKGGAEKAVERGDYRRRKRRRSRSRSRSSDGVGSHRLSEREQRCSRRRRGRYGYRSRSRSSTRSSSRSRSRRQGVERSSSSSDRSRSRSRGSREHSAARRRRRSSRSSSRGRR